MWVLHSLHLCASNKPVADAATRCPHCHLPQDAYNSGFALLRAQGVCRPAYLQAALAEYLASLCCHGAQVAPSLAALYVDLLLDQVGKKEQEKQAGDVAVSVPLHAAAPVRDSGMPQPPVQGGAARLGGKLQRLCPADRAREVASTSALSKR